LKKYARTLNPNFLLVGKGNVESIMTSDKFLPTNGQIEEAYVKSMDGWLMECLYYGALGDNSVSSPIFASHYLSYLALLRSRCVKPLALDFTTNSSRIDDAYNKSSRYGLISFSTTSKLDSLVSYPKLPFNSNKKCVENLADARNYFMISNYAKFASKMDFINRTRVLNYDLLIVNPYFSRSVLFNQTELGLLKVKPEGGVGCRRNVLCQMWVGEVLNSSAVWQSTWRSCAGFVGAQSSISPYFFKTKYWMSEWKERIYGNNASEVWKYIEAGCDGILA
jgi:cysteinyl-tRNA synthetase